jgi:hypothetical protein
VDEDEKTSPKRPIEWAVYKKHPSNRKSMSFMINRKIKWFGIEPFDFVKMPRTYTMDKYRVKITEAVSKT